MDVAGAEADGVGAAGEDGAVVAVAGEVGVAAGDDEEDGAVDTMFLALTFTLRKTMMQ